LTILESERLLFREHKAEDLDAFCEIQADTEVRRYVGGFPLPREAAERRFRERFLVPKPNRLALWVTIYKPDGLYIGQRGVYPNFEASDDRPAGPIAGEGTLGLYLARTYWGKGLATEAGRAFLDFGFNELGLSRIVTAVEIGNDASVRVVEKLGFSLVRTELGAVRSFYHFELLPNR
jgi:[ribosomal protein S5]-alanine N-acetyltransferase